MSTDLITFRAPTEVRERSALTVRVYFRDTLAAANSAPTNVYYRVDDDGTGIVLADWTLKTAPTLPTNYVDVVVTADQNRVITDAREIERKTISVMVDRGLATQSVASYGYAVRNLGWVS